MKARIIKHEMGEDVWFEVQYKYFLFWHSYSDCNDVPFEFYTRLKARETCERMLQRDKKTIVETFEG